MNTFDKNLLFLKQHASASSVDAVLQAAFEPPAVEWATDDDVAVLVAVTESGRRTPVHSRHPVEEASRLVKRWSEENPLDPGCTVAALGVGGGYHLQALADTLVEGGALLVIDPNPSAVRTMLERSRLDTLGESLPEVWFIVNRDEELIYREFLEYIETRPRIDYHFFTHPGTLRVFAEQYRPMAPRLAERVRVNLLHRKTVSNLSCNWVENALRNTPILVESIGLTALENIMAGLPAAVVGAGPSLDQTIPALGKMQDRVVIISVGTALRPLLAAGIRPHFVIVVDGSELLEKQFEGVDTDGMYLLAPPQIHTPLLARFGKRLISFATSALPEFDRWLADLGAPTATLRAAGTVTLTALDASLFLGCSKVFVFGLDLANAEDDTSHATNSMYDNMTGSRGELVEVPGNVRATVRTTRQFAAYIEIASGYITGLSDPVRESIANVNTDGARIPGMGHILPESIQLNGAPVADDVGQRLDPVYSADRRGNLSQLRKGLYQARRQLYEIERDAKRAEQLCLALVDPARAGRPADAARNSKLKQLEKKLVRKTTGGSILCAAVRAQTMETLAFCAGFRNEDEAQFGEVHRKCGQFYGCVACSAQWMRNVVNCVLNDSNLKSNKEAKERVS
jgi:hypothetical protein